MTAPADASLPEPAPGDASPPEPAPGDASPPEPAPGGASPPEPAPGAETSPLDTPLGTGQNLRGHYAGFASRFIAFIFDCVVSIGVFMLILAAASFAASVLTGSSIHWNRGNTWVVIAFFAWEFFYYAYFWTASGKTPGMVLLGVQVVGQDGSRPGSRRGLIRTLAFPLSFILLGLGFLGILLGRDRRALHDVIAGTAVVYCWDAREARLRSLAREGGERQR
jgi:uncharacterized RDD family membrane protein YckC